MKLKGLGKGKQRKRERGTKGPSDGSKLLWSWASEMSISPFLTCQGDIVSPFLAHVKMPNGTTKEQHQDSREQRLLSCREHIWGIFWPNLAPHFSRIWLRLHISGTSFTWGTTSSKYFLVIKREDVCFSEHMVSIIIIKILPGTIYWKLLYARCWAKHFIHSYI